MKGSARLSLELISKLSEGSRRLALAINLLKLYIPLVVGVLVGIILGRFTSAKIAFYLGNFLLWIGVPITIIYFLRGVNLTGLVWVAPLVAWSAIFLGILLAWVGMRWLPLNLTLANSNLRSSRSRPWGAPTQGSFLLTSMVGNTGYLGYPIALALVGPQHFVWALFYDLLGTTLGAYSLGLAIAARFGRGKINCWGFLQQLLQNPPLWSFILGMKFRDLPLPLRLNQMLAGAAWLMVALSLILIGMRLGQLSSWGSWRQAGLSLGIKMVLVPLAIGIALSLFGFQGPVRLALVLQMAMPPAFATLVLTEVYGLDKDLTVTTLAAGTGGLLVTLPLWLWLFGV